MSHWSGWSAAGRSAAWCSLGYAGLARRSCSNALRSKALDRGWGTGKVEARPDTSLRRPLTGALHAAVRELSVRHRAPDRVREVLAHAEGVRAADQPARRQADRALDAGDRRAAGIGRADSGDMEIDLLELLTDVAGLAADVGVGVAVFIDEMQDLTPEDVSALCASCHELSQTGAPLMVVGAGLPHLPSVLSASKSYSERLFRYVRIDRLDPAGVERALLAPAEREGATWAADALAAMGATSGRISVLRAGVREGGLGSCARLAHHCTPTLQSPHRRRRLSSAVDSSAPGTSERRRPSGTICAPWPA